MSEILCDLSLEQHLSAELHRDGDNPIESILPVGYDSEITEDVYKVMVLLRDERGIFYTKIAERLQLDQKYVHLILEVVAAARLTEYGCSPRGSWLTEKGEQLLAMADAWKAERAHGRP